MGCEMLICAWYHLRNLTKKQNQTVGTWKERLWTPDATAAPVMIYSFRPAHSGRWHWPGRARARPDGAADNYWAPFAATFRAASLQKCTLRKIVQRPDSKHTVAAKILDTDQHWLPAYLPVTASRTSLEVSPHLQQIQSFSSLATRTRLYLRHPSAAWTRLRLTESPCLPVSCFVSCSCRYKSDFLAHKACS